MRNGDLRVFARNNALEEQFDGHGIPQPLHELPIQTWGISSGYL